MATKVNASSKLALELEAFSKRQYLGEVAVWCNAQALTLVQD